MLFHAEQAEGAHRQQVERLLRTVDVEPMVVEQAASVGLMPALVAAGYGVGFANASLSRRYRNLEVIARPLAGRSALLTTYLLRPDAAPTEQLGRLIGRAVAAEVEAADAEADA